MNILNDFWSALILFRLNAWEYPFESLLIALLIFLIMQNRSIYRKRQLSDAKLGFLLNMFDKAQTPLTMASNQLAELAANGNSDSATRVITQAMEHIEHANERYDHVKALDKMNGKMDCDFKTAEHELYGYITSLTKQCRMYADSHQVQLRVTNNAGYLGCRINEVMLTAALQCLVEKVIDVTPKSGCVNITVSYWDDHWSLEIFNSPDFEKNNKRRLRLLRSFMRVSCCGNLTLIRRIIHMHGGKMTGFGREGAVCFEITIPINNDSSVEDHSVAEYASDAEHASDAETVPAKAIASSAPDNKPNVLLLMDDKELSGYLKKALFDLYQVTVLDDFELISDSFRNRNPEVVIIDSTINGVSGIDYCSKIKSGKSTSNIPVLLLMDSDDMDAYLACRNSGADGVMSRMIHIGKLKVDLQALIDGRAFLRKQFQMFIDENFPGGLPQTITKEEEDIRFIEQIQQILAKNLAEEGYTVEKLTLDMGMSHTKLYTTMIKVTGKSPKDYMFSFRMDKARLLLFAQQYTIAEIATMVGYSDSKYFGKLFKKYFNSSPTEYAKSALGEAILQQHN